MYTPSEFGERIRVSVKTLQRWDRQGVLKAHRTATNRRYYTQEDLLSLLPQEAGVRRRIIVYCRVSSVAQKPDLKNQQRILAEFCEANRYEVDEWISEIGGGLNFKRKQFLRLVDAIIAGEVAVLLIAHKDRLARFGYHLLVHLCETHDCKIVVMNTEQLSPEQELVQDLITITHCFSSRLYGLRRYRKALEKALTDENRAQDQNEPHT
ncbi:IS607 family transposase [Dictyobacter arantiisoli]|uniref:IS607 family transposase n=1 Tax=Dictyobacter arantiisoli TaxID=2014874 RepID=UPI0011ECF4AE